MCRDWRNHSRSAPARLDPDLGRGGVYHSHHHPHHARLDGLPHHALMSPPATNLSVSEGNSDDDGYSDEEDFRVDVDAEDCDAGAPEVEGDECMRRSRAHPPLPPTTMKGSAGSSSSEDGLVSIGVSGPVGRHMGHSSTDNATPGSARTSPALTITIARARARTWTDPECIYSPRLQRMRFRRIRGSPRRCVRHLRPVRAVLRVTAQIDTMHAEGGTSITVRGTHREDSVSAFLFSRALSLLSLCSCSRAHVTP